MDTDNTWIMLGLMGWSLASLVVLIFFRMPGDQDRAARRLEKALAPFSEVTITRAGEG
jgi:hypothetical protein